MSSTFLFLSLSLKSKHMAIDVTKNIYRIPLILIEQNVNYLEADHVSFEHQHLNE